MKAKYLFLLMLFSLGLFSCKKDKTSFNTSAKILVFDDNLQQAVPNVDMYILEVKRTKKDFLSKPQYEQTKLKMGTTNSNGEIDFGTFETHDNDNYEYYIVNNNFIYKGESSLSKGSNNFRVLFKNSYTQLNFNFIPPPPYGTNDSLNFNIKQSHIVNYGTYFGNFDLTITNNTYSTIYRPWLIPSGKFYISIKKYKNGLYTLTNDTVFYTPLTTNDYNLYW